MQVKGEVNNNNKQQQQLGSIIIYREQLLFIWRFGWQIEETWLFVN